MRSQVGLSDFAVKVTLQGLCSPAFSATGKLKPGLMGDCVPEGYLTRTVLLQ